MRGKLPIRSQLVGAALAHVRAAGGDADGLARAFKLPTDAASLRDVVLPLGDLQALLERASKMMGDPDLGVHVAMDGTRGSWDVVEFSARSAPTLRAACAYVARYAPLFNDLVTMTFDDHGETASLDHRIEGRPLCLGRHGNEFWVVTLRLHARALTNTPCVPVRAWLAHPAPRDRRELERALGTGRIAFDSERNGFELAASDLDAPVLTRDPALLSLVERFGDLTLSARTVTDGVRGTARAIVRERLTDGPPSLAAVARALGVSARTLQRQLAQDGEGFHDLVDGVRAELARAWVSEGRRTIPEMAALLGYAEPSAFLRAFRRWTGATPKGFRTG